MYIKLSLINLLSLVYVNCGSVRGVTEYSNK